MTPENVRREMRIVLDAARLPSYAFGHQSMMWWGTAGVMVIEGMVFALAIMVYFYYWTRVQPWPPDVLPPELRWGTLNLALMVASAWPNQLAKRAAERHDLWGARLGITMCSLFALTFCGVRALEFTTLNCRWDTNPYGSAVWMLLGLHTTHVVTDAYDTLVLNVLMFTGPLEGKRFVDVSENAMYWYFVIGAWLPIYAVIYLAPRVL